MVLHAKNSIGSNIEHMFCRQGLILTAQEGSLRVGTPKEHRGKRASNPRDDTILLSRPQACIKIKPPF
jgi:hypothetical protein